MIKGRKNMQLTIKLPDIISNEQISQFVKEIKQIFTKEGISIEIKQELPSEDDPWDTLDIEKIAVDTGIEDFAKNHDYYLYGTPKQ